MADEPKGPLGGPLSNGGQVGGGGPGLSGSRSGPGEGAPAGADDRYGVGLGDADREGASATANAGFATGGSGATSDNEAVPTDAGETPPLQGREGRLNSRGDEETYAPSTVAVNRSRMQGGGVGAQDIDMQRDPTGARSAEQYGRTGPKEDE